MRSISILAFISFLAACTEDVSKGKAVATVTDAPAATDAPATPAATDAPAADKKTLTVDVARSKLGALGAKVTATHPIDFPTYTATVDVAGGQVVGLSYEADMASLVSDDADLTGHLKNEDFFDVPNHPKSTFKATSITAGATGENAEGMTHTVTGDLTIRGTTKRVSFPAKIEIKADVVEASTEFAIDRKDFNIVYAGRADNLIQDKVVLKVQFVAPNA